jgi:hypothetical protein
VEWQKGGVRDDGVDEVAISVDMGGALGVGEAEQEYSVSGGSFGDPTLAV